MSIENRDGKGTLAIKYLFPSDKIAEQVELENKLKKEISEVLRKNGVQKYLIADDEFINENLLNSLEKANIPRYMWISEKI